jgi:microcystin-dependent protein
MSVFSQVGINTDSPAEDSILDIESSDKGILIPRINLPDANSISPITNITEGNSEGLLVYNTNPGNEGFYYWKDNKWNGISGNTIGDIKNGFQIEDHGGWYILDGRLISSLPPKAQAHAEAIFGVTATNLPDATDKFLKAKNGSETLASTEGSNTVSITQANLPDYNLPMATTDVRGDHTHQYDDKGSGETEVLLDIVIVVDGILSGLLNMDITRTSVANTSSVTTVTANEGNHSHDITVNSGGNNQPLSNIPASLVTNVFVYLGE